jgi:hypothetical protein
MRKETAELRFDILLYSLEGLRQTTEIRTHCILCMIRHFNPGPQLNESGALASIDFGNKWSPF